MLTLSIIGVVLLAALLSAFPTPKVHRANRRKLGRGQHVQLPPATCVVTGSGSNAVLTFNVPVVVNGSLDVVPTGLTLVSQTQISPTVWNVLYSGAVAGIAYEGIPAGSPIVHTMQGGGFVGIPAGTF